MMTSRGLDEDITCNLPEPNRKRIQDDFRLRGGEFGVHEFLGVTLDHYKAMSLSERYTLIGNIAPTLSAYKSMKLEG